MWGYIPGGAVIGTARWAGGKGKGRARARARARSRSNARSYSVVDWVGGIALMFVFIFVVALFV
jgi:hypothetical protein